MRSEISFNKLFQRLSQAGAMLVLAAVVSCSGMSAPNLPAGGGTQPPFLAQLPPVPAPSGGERVASAPTTDVKLGSNSFTQSGGATLVGSSMRLTSTPGGIQWAIYHYLVGANTLVELFVNHTAHSGTSTWVGLANFDALAWEFTNPYPTSTPAIDLSDPKYTSSFGDLFFVVITYDGTDTSVDSIDITVDVPSATYGISGTVLEGGTTALPNVQLTLTPGGATVLTNASGAYSFGSLAPGSYTVTPVLAGFVFVPLSQNVNITNADQNGIDFTATAQATVTYTADIQPLLALKCTSCHNAGGASGGYKLDSYAEAVANAAVANAAIQDESMPPGGGPLSAEQKALFQAWVDAGTPE